MPQLNAWVGSGAGVNPWSSLQTHTHRSIAYGIMSAQKRFKQDLTRQADKQSGLSEYVQPYKRPRTSPPISTRRMYRSRRRTRPTRRYPKRRRRTRGERSFRRMKYRIRNFHPREQVVRCRVASEYVLTCTSGAKAQLNLRTNDIIDPFGSGGAEQPLHYDTWKSMYAKAVVIGYKARIMFENTGAAAVLVACRLLSDDEQTGTSYTTVDHLVEAGAQQLLLSPEFDKGAIVRKCSPRKQAHVRSLRDQSAYHIDLDAETAPTTLLYDHISAQPIDKASSVTVQMFVQVEYIVLLFDRNVVSRSTGT